MLGVPRGSIGFLEDFALLHGPRLSRQVLWNLRCEQIATYAPFFWDWPR